MHFEENVFQIAKKLIERDVDGLFMVLCVWGVLGFFVCLGIFVCMFILLPPPS